MKSISGAMRNPSNTVGDQQARRMRQQVIEVVQEKTGVVLPLSMTLDQLVRAAAKAGVSLYVCGTDTRRLIGSDA